MTSPFRNDRVTCCGQVKSVCCVDKRILEEVTSPFRSDRSRGCVVVEDRVNQSR